MKLKSIIFFILLPGVLFAKQPQKFSSFDKSLLPYKNGKPLTQKLNELSIEIQTFKKRAALPQPEKQKLKRALVNYKESVKSVEVSYTVENLKKTKAAIQNFSFSTYPSVNAENPLFEKVKNVEQLIDKAIKEIDGAQKRIENRPDTGHAPQPVQDALNNVVKIAKRNRRYLKIKGMPTTNYRGYIKELKELNTLLPIINKKYESTEHRKVKLALGRLQRRIRNIKRSITILKKENGFKQNIQKMDEVNETINKALKELKTYMPHKSAQ